ncbi:MAG: hypothetical protein FWD69_14955 [Polyangiaceae bacterium]|nr:hypothetical protein [Polyangiaceae bacterium]
MEDRDLDDDMTDPIEYTQWSKPHRDILNRKLWDGPTLGAMGVKSKKKTLVGIGSEGPGTRQEAVQEEPKEGKEEPVPSVFAEPAKPKEEEVEPAPIALALSEVKELVLSIVTDKQRLTAVVVVAVLVTVGLVYRAIAKPMVNRHAEPVTASVAVSTAPSITGVSDAVTSAPAAASTSTAVDDATIKLHPPAMAKPPVHKKPVAATAPPAVPVEKKEVAPEAVVPPVAPVQTATALPPVSTTVTPSVSPASKFFKKERNK